MIVPSLLRPRSSDEYAPLPWSAADREAIARYDARRPRRRLDRPVRRLRARPAGHGGDLRAIDAAHGGGFFAVPERAAHELDAAEAAFRGARPGGRRADPPRRPGALGRPGRGRARRLPAHGRSRSLAGRDRSARDRRRGVGRARVRRVGDRGRVAHVDARAAPTSTCSPTAQIAAGARRRRPLRGHRAACSRTRSCTRTSARPSSTRWSTGARRCGRRAGSATRCRGRRRRRRRPAAGSSTTTRSASRSSSGCARSARASSRRTRASAARSPTRRSRPRRRATSARPRPRSPTSRSSCTTPATSAIPTAQEGPYDPARDRDAGVDRLVRSLADAGIGPAATCTPSSAARGSSCCAGRVEAAHVLGKLLVALGPERIVWGTDSRGTDRRNR